MTRLFAFHTSRELSTEELELTAPTDTGHYDVDSQTWVGGSESTAGPCSFTTFYPYNVITRGDYWTTC